MPNAYDVHRMRLCLVAIELFGQPSSPSPFMRSWVNASYDDTNDPRAAVIEVTPEANTHLDTGEQTFTFVSLIEGGRNLGPLSRWFVQKEFRMSTVRAPAGSSQF
jgi:hypothetical protein